MTLAIIESLKIKTIWTARQCYCVAAASFVLGTIIFVVAYIGMLDNTGIGSFNQPILSWMIAHRDSQITNIMKLITDIASPAVFAIIIGVGAGFWAFIKREIWRPILLIGATSIAAVMSVVFKNIIINDRPPIADMIAPFEINYSFPSGHTIGVVVCLLVLGYLLCSRHFNTIRIFVWAAITVLGVGLIATSRLYLGYHWLTDIVASIGLGFIILAVSIIVDIFVIRRLNN